MTLRLTEDEAGRVPRERSSPWPSRWPAAVAVAGGDNGGGVSFAEGGTPHDTPTSAEVVGCLKTAGRKTGFTVSQSAADRDSISRQATDRAVAIDAGGKRAMVIFERTEQEAVSRYVLELRLG
jgi:hypothetical protein